MDLIIIFFNSFLSVPSVSIEVESFSKNHISCFLSLFYLFIYSLQLTLKSFYTVSDVTENADSKNAELCLRKLTTYILSIALTVMDICSITHFHGARAQCTDFTFVIPRCNNKHHMLFVPHVAPYAY